MKFILDEWSNIWDIVNFIIFKHTFFNIFISRARVFSSWIKSNVMSLIIHFITTSCVENKFYSWHWTLTQSEFQTQTLSIQHPEEKNPQCWIIMPVPMWPFRTRLWCSFVKIHKLIHKMSDHNFESIHFKCTPPDRWYIYHQ